MKTGQKGVSYSVSKHKLASGYRWDCKVNRIPIASRPTRWELFQDVVNPLITKGLLQG